MVEPIAKAMKRFIALLLVAISGCKPAPAPSADLASPSQEVRDAPAKVLRATAKPPSKLKWFFFTRQFYKGEHKTDVLALLRSHHLSTQIEGGSGGGGSDYEEFRLDDYWLLGFDFHSTDQTLMQWELISRWRDFYMPAPTNYNGVWVTYYANGQKSSEVNYTNGYRSGEFITFQPDGSKSSVWLYDNGIRQGLYTQYFPSGHIQYQVQYSNNFRIGVGVWFNEGGSTNHVTDYSKPRTNAVFSPN